MINIRSEEEIDLIRESNILVGKTLAEVAKLIRPGVSLISLDKTAEEFIRDNGAEPGFKGYQGFPATLCTSVNDEVVHGIPNEKRYLKEGDIISVDCGVYWKGYYGDSAYTFAVGEISKAVSKLLQVTKESLYQGIEKAISGKRLGDVGYAIQSYVQNHGYSVVREMVGHGVGTELHEEPQVPNYGKAGRGRKLAEGMVIAIEPMINLGKKNIFQADDGWTIATSDHQPSAHFEHSVVVRKNKAEILSTFKYIEEVIKTTKDIGFYG